MVELPLLLEEAGLEHGESPVATDERLGVELELILG